MSKFLDNLAAQCPENAPFRFLRFTWFGDFACSSGAHYESGNRLPFERILKTVNKEHSDDLVENLACWTLLEQVPDSPSPENWKELCWKFYDLIKEDFLPDPVRYSPEYLQLFADRSTDNYLDVLKKHSNCGGAMRSASLAYGGASEYQHLTLVGMTHLYPESLAGAFALFEAVRILKEGGSQEDMWEGGIEAAAQGEETALELLEDWGEMPVERGRMVNWMKDVYVHKEARYGLQDWRSEGISTRFVVSGAMQIAREAIPLGPRKALRHVVEQCIEIGGDPDTLGSMGMALTGAYFNEDLQAEIDLVLEEMIAPENIDLPEFFR